MGAAKVVFATQDRSAVIQGLSGIFAGIVVRSKKGPVNMPRLMTSEGQYINVYGTPDLRYPENQSAIHILKSTDKVWTVRAAADDVKYGGVLVRGGNFNMGPDYDDDVKKIVEPFEKGLTQDELDSYNFIQKEKIIQVEKELDKPGATSINSYEFVLNGAPKNIAAGQKIVISSKDDYAEITDYDVDGEGFKIVEVLDVKPGTHKFDRIILDEDSDGNQTTLTVKKGTKVKNKANDATAIVLIDGDEAPFIIVDNADEFHDGDEIVVLDENDEETDDTAIQKIRDQIDLYFVHTKQPVTVSSSDTIYKITKVSIWEQMYSFMVTGVNPGKWNDSLEIGIEKSKDYPDMKAFYLVVYENGEEVERWLVSKDREFIDGFGKKLYIETVVNGFSEFIQVKDNIFAKTINGEVLNPKPTNYSIWRKNKDMIFYPAKNDDGVKLESKEDLFVGDIEIFLNDTDGLDIGDTIKFAPNYESRDVIYGTDLYELYTIEDIDRDNKQLFLDRSIQRDYNYDDANEKGWIVYKWQKDLTDVDKHIVEGYQYYPYTILSYPLTGEHIGDYVAIGTSNGKVLDAGVNYMEKADDGSPVSLADMIMALRKLSNNTETPVQLLLDGGYTIPAYAQEMLRVANAQGENNTHCYWSMDPSAEESADALKATGDYANKLMLNTHLGSLFTGWVKQYCPYNKEYVWTAPSTYGAISQNFVHRNYSLFTPAAGLVRGKVLGLEIKHQFSDGELDVVVDNRINPIIYKQGQGLIIWGNRTMYAKPSPLQLRSVAFLLMAIRYGLESYLKYELFNYNNPETWNRIKTTIDSFMGNSIKAKGGVYDFKCVVSPTDFDIDNRKLPVFLGIQPTMDINEIKVTLAVFNKSLAITV